MLIPEERYVSPKPVQERYVEVKTQSVPVTPAITFSTQVAKVTSKGKALKHKKKKRAKKRKVMKKSSRPKARPRKHAKRVSTAPVSSQKIGEGSTHKWMHKERALLDAALRDLNRELSGLRNSRRKLEEKMAEFSDNLGSTQSKEISLRTQISDLMKKETVLTKKKSTAKDKIADIDQKIEKVRSIQADLKTV